jgi:hypothetical protein
MPVIIQIRNVPKELHRQLKVEEVRARLARRSTVMPSIPPARAVRAERDGRKKSGKPLSESRYR